MIVVRYALLMVLAVLVQTSWAHKLSILGVRPDFVLLVVVCVGIASGQIKATVLGFVSGFLLDVYNPAFMGVNALAYSVVGFAVGYIHESIVAEELTVQGVVVFVAGLMQNLIFFVFSSISNPWAIIPLFLRFGLGSAVYTAAAGVAVLLLLSIRIQGGLRLDVRRLHE